MDDIGLVHANSIVAAFQNAILILRLGNNEAAKLVLVETQSNLLLTENCPASPSRVPSPECLPADKDPSVVLSSSTGRPVTDPPIFNYDSVVQDLSSVKKLRIVFPNDSVTRTRWRDIETESVLEETYYDWVMDTILKHPTYVEVKTGTDDDDTFSGLRELAFYQCLLAEITEDGHPLHEELVKVRDSFDVLTQWEIHNLGSDGSTDSLLRRLNRGEDVFSEKYGYLIDKMKRIPHDLETWEYYHVNDNDHAAIDIVKAAQKTWFDARIRNIFTPRWLGGAQALEKYGHLNEKMRNIRSYGDEDEGSKGWFNTPSQLSLSKNPPFRVMDPLSDVYLANLRQQREKDPKNTS